MCEHIPNVWVERASVNAPEQLLCLTRGNLLLLAAASGKGWECWWRGVWMQPLEMACSKTQPSSAQLRRNTCTPLFSETNIGKPGSRDEKKGV